MKKAVTALLLIGALLGGYLGVAHISGAAFPTLGLMLGGDRGLLRRVAMEFMEDIQFKDFVAAASYHAPDLIETVDIPFLIQRLFAVKPEALEAPAPYSDAFEAIRWFPLPHEVAERLRP